MVSAMEIPQMDHQILQVMLLLILFIPAQFPKKFGSYDI